MKKRRQTSKPQVNGMLKFGRRVFGQAKPLGLFLHINKPCQVL